MQQPPETVPAARRRIRLGLAALTAAALFGGAAACGTGTAPAAQVASHTGTAPRTGTASAAPAAGQAEARVRLRDLERSYQGRIGL